MSRSFRVEPHRAIGPVVFGMSRSEVEAAMGQTPERAKRNRLSIAESKPGVRRSARVESGEATESPWRPRGAIFYAVLAVWGCSGTDEGKRDGVPRTPVVLAPDTTNVDVTWKPETVVVDADTIATSLRNRYADGGVYRFDPAATEIAALSPGQVVVLRRSRARDRRRDHGGRDRGLDRAREPDRRGFRRRNFLGRGRRRIRANSAAEAKSSSSFRSS